VKKRTPFQKRIWRHRVRLHAWAAIQYDTLAAVPRP
jgi:hypothetical protein